MIEYAVEHGMMEKTALNAMSRKGYRELDLAHRMIRDVEKHVKEERPRKAVRKRLEEKLNDLRTDYLHPTRHSVLGDMKGSKMLYKPFHDYGRVDPKLAREVQRSRAGLQRSLDAHHQKRQTTRAMRGEQIEDSRANRLFARRYAGDKALYAPRLENRESGVFPYTAPSASVKERGALKWRSSRADTRNYDDAGQVSFRNHSALSGLRQQLAKVQRRASSASIFG